MARGTIGWPFYPQRTPSTIDLTTIEQAEWMEPRWNEVWFPDAFAGPMAELMCAIEENRDPDISGKDNLHTMALVDACYRSYRDHRAVNIAEILSS
jgi:predicted dehydrogenase